MTDEEVSALIDDPVKILTHEVALEVIEVLDSEIANIQAQIDAAQISANARPLTADKLAWVQRASYAAAMRRNERHRVMQRDKELRGTKNWGGKPKDPDKKEANIVKQQRLAAEVEIRRAAKQFELIKVQNEREALANQRRKFQVEREARFERLFVETARACLAKDQFEYICACAKSADQSTAMSFNNASSTSDEA